MLLFNNVIAVCRLFAGVIAAILTFAIAGSGISALAASEISFETRPDWVDRVDLPEINDARLNQVQDGVYYLVSDTQARIEDDRYVFYRRLAVQITNRTGLESAARLQFVFDPLDDVFSVHTVTLRRAGQTIDRLNPDSFIVARQESDMANGVTDGNLTVYAEIPDVRVGDVVDYEVSWTSQSALWPGHYSDSISSSWSVPIAFFQHRILAPAALDLTIKNNNTDFEPEITSANDYRDLRWWRIDPDIVPSQEAVPETFSNWGYVSVSTFSRWGEVVDSLIGDYDAKSVLPPDFAANHSWYAEDRALSEKITAAIRYVQDEVRYVGDETGVGSHLPRAPTEVIARGWGDCKDKSLLLTAILRSLGIEAYVALTDADQGYSLPQAAPSPYAFDHAIVVYIVDGVTYWNDPTSYDQGGVFPDIAQPVYGYGLPLKAGNGALWEMTPPGVSAPEKVVQEIFDFSEFNSAGVGLEVVSTYVGRQADSFRRILATSSPHQLAQDYLSYYQGQYPGITAVSDMAIDDDRDANRVKVIETYYFEREHYAEKPLETAFPLRADAVLGVLSEVNFTSRTAPVALPYPVDYKHIFTLKTVSDFEGPKKFSHKSDFLDFERMHETSGVDTNIIYRMTTKAIEAPVDMSTDYQSVIDDLNDYGALEFTYGADALDEEIGVWEAVGVLVGLAVIVYLIIAIVAQLKRDEALMETSVFYPVSMTKFVILNVATFGYYGIFWMWRCWRWVKFREERAIMPFWRAFFSFIWFYPLFSEIRDHQSSHKTRVFIGVTLAVAYVVFYFAGNIADAVYEGGPLISLSFSMLSGITFLFTMPLVRWVNHLNTESPVILERNSRWTGHTFGALMFGGVLWGFIVWASYL
ncbi:DUF3857 and transglutaminase domain-containing protein [Hyphococcus flavus]|uniref:DUF3857 and transglutaminase domain-containing protein n=1 Tax=Hyphococcus flavus TaxID=1866326 RepID=A0AAE9ZFD1_9PROT|nr:DUF3857 and transglutaminase domain-containing protein [Hyphococcus flavus]WDI32780.1 DUF3857 and transglutaminase domain-containing protein [Hyphococcus flavus]